MPWVYEEMVTKVVAFIEKEGNVTPAQARDLLGTTRLYTLPLLNHLDGRKITRRERDGRVLTKAYSGRMTIEGKGEQK